MVAYSPCNIAKKEADLHGDHIPVVHMPKKHAKNGLINYIVSKYLNFLLPFF